MEGSLIDKEEVEGAISSLKYKIKKAGAPNSQYQVTYNIFEATAVLNILEELSQQLTEAT